jgi:hypothetical protein
MVSQVEVDSAAGVHYSTPLWLARSPSNSYARQQQQQQQQQPAWHPGLLEQFPELLQFSASSLKSMQRYMQQLTPEHEVRVIVRTAAAAATAAAGLVALTPVAQQLRDLVASDSASCVQGQQQQQQQQQQHSAVIATSLKELKEILHVTGTVLCTGVACGSCCNNPSCVNVSTVSEGFALVRGKGCMCGGCARQDCIALPAR